MKNTGTLRINSLKLNDSPKSSIVTGVSGNLALFQNTIINTSLCFSTKSDEIDMLWKDENSDLRTTSRPFKVT